nr:hypothetical protein [Tanacetum cinerariifolium]
MDVKASTTVAPLPLSTPTLTPSTIATISTVPQAPTPLTTAPSTLLQDLPNFGSLFGFDHRLKTLEANFFEFMQTNQFAGAVSSILGIVQRYTDQRMNEAVKVAVQIQSDRLCDEAQADNEKFPKNLDENIQKIIKEQVKEQIYELGKSSIKMRVKHHEEQVVSILNYLKELSFHHIEKIEERLVNGWIIIPKDFDEVKTKLKEPRTQIRKLQKKCMGQRDKIAFIHFRIDLEMTLEDIQDRHQLYVKNHMGHTS